MSFSAGDWPDETPSPLSAAPSSATAPAKGAGGAERGDRDKKRIVRRVKKTAAGKQLRRARDDDDDATAAAARRPAAAADDRPPAPLGVGRFHAVTDREYSDVALPRPGEQGKRGGAWIGATCRCMQCELTRLAQKLVLPPAKQVVVLLDLDNYGYPQMVKLPAPKAMKGDFPSEMVIWGFYGLGFVEHGHKEPEEAIQARSLLGLARLKNQLQLSPCGNFPQAADEAMQAAVLVLRNVHLVLVTADKQHIQACRAAHSKQQLLPGRPQKGFAAVDPKQFGGSCADVWRAVVAAASQFGS